MKIPTLYWSDCAWVMDLPSYGSHWVEQSVKPSHLQYSTTFTPFEHFGDLLTFFGHIWYSSLELALLVFHHPPLEYFGHVGHYEAFAIAPPRHLSKIQEWHGFGCWQRQILVWLLTNTRQGKYRDSWRPTHLADKSTPYLFSKTEDYLVVCLQEGADRVATAGRLWLLVKHGELW